MHGYAPKMMGRKIPRSLVQHAFILNTIYNFVDGVKTPKILCVGSFEDTVAASLKAMGYTIEEIDPALNYDLDSYCNLPSTDANSYDIIFSTSVLEHVDDDKLFIEEIAGLLKPGGTAILTCDYNNNYKPGDKLPKTDVRFYTEKDMRRLLSYASGCNLVDAPSWYHGIKPDFTNEGCNYSFATLTFRKSE
jgi:SAM-dependent methyltransferase